MPTCPSPSKSESGFTLIEMLVVLTILGVAAALLAGRIGDPPSRLTRDRAVAALAGRIDTARAEAIRSGRPARVDFAAIAGAELRSPVFGGEPQLTFFPDGSSNGGTIAVGGEPVLEIDWLTGNARDAR